MVIRLKEQDIFIFNSVYYDKENYLFFCESTFQRLRIFGEASQLFEETK